MVLNYGKEYTFTAESSPSFSAYNKFVGWYVCENNRLYIFENDRICSYIDSVNQSHTQEINLTFTEDMFANEHLAFRETGDSITEYNIHVYAIWTDSNDIDNRLRCC